MVKPGPGVDPQTEKPDFKPPYIRPMPNRYQEKAVRYAEEHGGAALVCYGCFWVGVVKTFSFGIIRVVGALQCPSCGTETKLLTRATERKTPVICDGCAVRPPHEHKCHVQPIMVCGERTEVKCECPLCNEIACMSVEAMQKELGLDRQEG